MTKIMKHPLFLLILIFCFSLLIFGQDSRNERAIELYKSGIEYYNEGKFKEAIDALKEVIKLDRKFSDARNKLAEIYIDMETPISRMKAEQELKKALSEDPENFEYRLNLAKTYLNRGFIYNSMKYFEFLTGKYPKNTEVLSNLGSIYTSYFEKYQNMFAPGPYGMAPFYDNNLYAYFGEYRMDDGFIGYDFISTISLDGSLPKIGSELKRLIEDRITSNNMGISFAKWVDEDYEKAVSTFNKIIQINPDHREAHFRLSVLAYDNRDVDSFIYHQKKIIENNPNDKDAHLFLGLGLHDINRNEEAFKEYEIAKRLMNDDEKEVFESLEYILSEDLVEKYKGLNDDERKKFIDKYWKSKDPLYLTDFSERMIEHYGRVAYSNLKFGVIKMDIPGWKSDRGRIYIRYGKPQDNIKIRPELEFAGPKGGYNSTIIWYYPKYTFVFSDPYSTGEYRLSTGLTGSRFPLIAFNQVEADVRKVFPENYEHNYGGELFAFNYYTASFRGENGNTNMEIYYGIPQKYVRYNPQKGRFSAQVKKGFFVFDGEWNDVKKDVSIDEFSSDFYPDSSQLTHIIRQNDLEIKPGKYLLAIEIQDESSKNTGISREIISVESFKSDSLKLSDIVFALKIDTVIKRSEFSSHGYEIIPNPLRHYKINQPLYVYYEIYNLKLMSPGMTNYIVEYKINKFKKKRSLFVRAFAGIGSLFGIGNKKEEISTSYAYNGVSPDEKQYLTINMKDAEQGLYQLSLTVSDLNSKQKVTKNRTILITSNDIKYIY